MDSKTILVTGGTGFLGSNLCEYLICRNERVICLDNNRTGSFDNIAALKCHPNFVFISHDICESFEFEEKIDQIYNLACSASPIHYQGKAALSTIKTCSYGVINMLELAKKHNARILQASTSEVYGNPLLHPQTEEYFGNVNPIGVRACYDEGKRISETLFFDYHRQEGIEIKIVRVFNTYGPKMSINDGRAVSNFICRSLLGADIEIYGDGSQTRSFCYVDDLIEAMVRMMDSSQKITGPINIGNPAEVTIKELAEEIKHKINRGRIVYRQLPQDDPVRRKPDITRAARYLDWTPKTELGEGLEKTIAYFRAKLEN